MPRIGSGEFKCLHKGCGRSFSRKYNLHAHMRMHSGEEPYACHVMDCGMKFMWRSGLSKHMERSHAGMEMPMKRKRTRPANVETPLRKASWRREFEEQLDSILGCDMYTGLALTSPCSTVSYEDKLSFASGKLASSDNTTTYSTGEDSTGSFATTSRQASTKEDENAAEYAPQFNGECALGDSLYTLLDHPLSFY